MKVTNHTRGPRGVNLKGGTTRWVEPGETVEFDKADIAGDLPDFGKAGDYADKAEDEITALRERVADLESENALLRAGKSPAGEKPGLTGKSKAKLLEIAEAEGVTIEDGATNEDIVSAIELHREG